MALRPDRLRFKVAGWMPGLSTLTHVVLWGLMLALPATALLALGGEHHPLTLLGGVRVDEFPWIAGSRLAEAADWGDVHEALGDALMWLAGLHALAALYHHFLLRDGELAAMLPWKTRR